MKIKGREYNGLILKMSFTDPVRKKRKRRGSLKYDIHFSQIIFLHLFANSETSICFESLINHKNANINIKAST